jgi:hypothetical protein
MIRMSYMHDITANNVAYSLHYRNVYDHNLNSILIMHDKLGKCIVQNPRRLGYDSSRTLANYAHLRRLTRLFTAIYPICNKILVKVQNYTLYGTES